LTVDECVYITDGSFDMSVYISVCVCVCVCVTTRSYLVDLFIASLFVRCMSVSASSSHCRYQ